MNPVLIIPTYVGTKRKSANYNVVATYDHVTPLTHQGELPRCLASIRDHGVEVPILLLVIAEPGVEIEAAAKIREIAFAYRETLDIRVIDADIATQFHARAEQLGITTIKEGISLTGYGASRNMGLLVGATLGFTEIIFIDDDEVITSPDFVEQALYGLGKLSKKGIPVLVKSGFYVDRKGQWRSRQSNAWYNRFWEQGVLFNKWITKAMESPRLSRSNILNGGLMAIHREAFRRVSFDPWISRGEDMDYLLNIRMYGGGVWFDNRWSVLHLPPTERNEAQRFKQDIYRWIYEHRKLEFSKTQIDLLQIPPHSLDPYPGPFLENSITKRAFLTALLRTLGRPRDRQGYFKAAQAARREARAYAEMFCSNYFEFQLGWAQVLATLEADPMLNALFGEASRVSPDDSVDYENVQIESSNPLYLAPMFSAAEGVHPGSDPNVRKRQVPLPMVESALQATVSGNGVPTEQGAEEPKPELFDFELDLGALGIDLDKD